MAIFLTSKRARDAIAIDPMFLNLGVTSDGLRVDTSESAQFEFLILT